MCTEHSGEQAARAALSGLPSHACAARFTPFTIVSEAFAPLLLCAGDAVQRGDRVGQVLSAHALKLGLELAVPLPLPPEEAAHDAPDDEKHQ